MKNDLTRVYNGSDLSGAAAGVIYLPIVRDATLEGIDVLTEIAVTGDVEFALLINGAEIGGADLALGEADNITIPDGAKSVSLTGLNIALSKFDKITLDLISGNISAPVTLNLATDDGESSGGGSGSGLLLSDLFGDLVKPEIADLTAVNILSDTALTDQTASLKMKSTVAQYNHFQGYGKSVSSPFTATIGMQILTTDIGLYSHGGMYVRSRANGWIRGISFRENQTRVFSKSAVGASGGFGSSLGGVSNNPTGALLIFYRITFDGVNRKFYCSFNNQGFNLVYNENIYSTGLSGDDEVGFFLDNEDSVIQYKVFHFEIS